MRYGLYSQSVLCEMVLVCVCRSFSLEGFVLCRMTQYFPSIF